MQYSNPYQVYKNQSLQTLTQGEILVKLFEEASKQINFSILLTEKQDAVGAYNCVSKAQKIVSTLRNSLDMNYAISINLAEIYLFVNDELGKALVDKDTETLKRLAGILDNLKDAFKEADKIARSQKRSVG